MNEQRERIRSLHSLVVQLSSSDDASGAREKDETGSAEARERTYEEKYKRAKNLLKVQAQHVSQLQGVRACKTASLPPLNGRERT